MELSRRIEDSITKVSKAIFPGTTNHYDTLFGGTALQFMDEVAFIAATRFTRKRVVTISSDKVNFKRAIPSGTIIELIAKVSKVGNTSLDVQVDIYLEEMYMEKREKAISGVFTFVAVDENKKAIPVL